MINYGLVTTRFDLWYNLAKDWSKAGFATPKFWLDTRLFQKEFQKTFPECTSVSLLDYNNWCKGSFDISNGLDYSLELPKDWSRIKDIVKLIFNRYNALGQWRNLDMDASIMNIFVHLSSLWPKTQIDVFIFTETPHTPVDFLIYQLCKLKGIPTLILQQSNLIPVTMFKWAIEGKAIPLKENRFSENLQEKLFAQIEQHFYNIVNDNSHQPSYVNSLNKINNQRIKYAFNRTRAILTEIYGNFSGKRTTRNVYRSFISLLPRPTDPMRAGFFNLKVRSKLHSYFLSNCLKDLPQSKFVFFPLHYEPERTTVPDGGDYYDQLLTVVKLRSNLDSSIPLVVKEHFLVFSMALSGHTGRSKYFYDVINALPNTYLISYELNTRETMKQALAVATISGSTLYESAALGIPAVMFGHSWFEDAPGIFRFEDVNWSKLKPAGSANELVDFFKNQMSKFAIPGAAHQSSLPLLKSTLEDGYSLNFEKRNLSSALIEIINTL